MMLMMAHECERERSERISKKGGRRNTRGEENRNVLHAYVQTQRKETHQILLEKVGKKKGKETITEG
jgi:hypothetical protein